MLEEKIDSLIASMDRLTAALSGAKTVTGAATTTTVTKTKGAAAKETTPKITLDVVKAAIFKVKDVRGKPAAQKIVREAGQAANSIEIKPERFKAVMEACEAALGDEDEDEAAEEADDSL